MSKYWSLFYKNEFWESQLLKDTEHGYCDGKVLSFLQITKLWIKPFNDKGVIETSCGDVTSQLYGSNGLKFPAGHLKKACTFRCIL